VIAFECYPPVSSLSSAQALYHFISGYHGEVAGTEMGVKEASGDILSLFWRTIPRLGNPSKYAELLAAKMKQHGTRVWLVNTGWSGGAYVRANGLSSRPYPRNRGRHPLRRAREGRNAT